MTLDNNGTLKVGIDGGYPPSWDTGGCINLANPANYPWRNDWYIENYQGMFYIGSARLPHADWGLRVHTHYTSSYFGDTDIKGDLRVGKDVGGKTVYARYFSAGYGGDISETFLTNENLDEGDVVVIDEINEKYIKLSQEPNSSNVIGVVVSSPAIILNSETDDGENPSLNSKKISILGRVKIKVTTENGPIRPGDLLTTSSKPGYAMKSTKKEVGTIIGKSLQNLQTGIGKIEAFINCQ